MSPSLDPYRLLGVPRDADAREIRRAFRRLALRYHPDRNPTDPASTVRFKEVVEAYRETVRKARAPGTRQAGLEPLRGAWLNRTQMVRRTRRPSTNLPVRWKRAASGFVLTHVRSVPIVVSMILSLLFTAVGLISDGAHGRTSAAALPAPAGQVTPLLGSG